jgi:hypothetical protein
MIRCALLIAGNMLLTIGALSAQTAQGQPPAPTAVEAPEVEHMEEVQIGDHWTYESRDEITGTIKSTITNTVTDVSSTGIGIRLGELGNSNSGYLTFDRSWNLIDNGTWKSTPNDGTGIRLPLALGKSWTFKSSDLNNTGGFGSKRTGTSKVVAQESLTTRAGTFDTFKIETSYELQNIKDPTRKIQIALQTWYAPLIDHWVKRSFVSRTEGRVRESSLVELVEYGRR